MSAANNTAKAMWEAAKWYIDHGATLVPAVNKHPFWDEWQLMRRDKMSDEYIYEHLISEGMAILTGIPGGPIIVDIDNPSLEQAIQENLPPTPIKVISGKSIHLWYGQGSTTVEYIHRRGILDVLGAGRCAMVPPSAHPSGVRYKISIDQEHFDALSINTWEDLPCLTEEHLEWLRTFSPKAPHLKVVDGDKSTLLPQVDLDSVPATGEPVEKGGRNNSLASLVGQWVYEDGLDIGALFDRALDWNIDNKPPLVQKEVLQTVLSVVKTHAINRQSKGERISPVAKKESSLKTDDAERPVFWEPNANDPSLKGVLAEPPGLLNDIKQWILQTSPQPQPGFAMQAALAVGSVAGARIWRTENNNYTSLYLVNIGDSGSGKERPLSATEELLVEAGLDDLVGPDAYTGSTAIHDRLLKSPAHLARLDEMGDYLSILHDRGQSMALDGVRTLKSLWGKLDGVFVGKAFAGSSTDNKQREHVLKPAVSIIGATTPVAFYRSLKTHDLEGGLIPRLLIFETSQPEEVPRDLSPEPIPSKITEWIKSVRRNPFGDIVSTIGSMDVTPRIIAISQQAKDIYQKFGEKIIRAKEKNKTSGMHIAINRTREKAFRIGAIGALFTDHENPEVTGDIANWACEYAWSCDKQTMDMLKMRLSVGEYDANKTLFLESIRAAGLRGVTKSEMARQRPFRSVRDRERRELLTDLMDAKLIVLAKVPSAGRIREAYVGLKELAEGV